MNAFEILSKTIRIQKNKVSLCLLDNFLSFLPHLCLLHLGFGVISVYFIYIIDMMKSLLTPATTVRIIM